MELLTTTTGLLCHTHQVEVPDCAEAHRPILFDVRDFATVQGAFDAAYGVGPVYLPGFVTTDTINYRGQSIQGSSMRDSGLIGKPGQDVLHLDPAMTTQQVDSMHWRDFKIKVDDSTNASASFPNRGGVGNAGFGADWPDGAATAGLILRFLDVSSVTFEALSGAVGGNGTKAAGIYTQGNTLNQTRWRNVFIHWFDYGFWDDYPTSNLASSDHARDHNHFDSIYFNANRRAWRMVNHAGGVVTNLVMHHNTYGLELKGAASIARQGNSDVQFRQMQIEYSDHPFTTDSTTNSCAFFGGTIHYTAGTADSTLTLPFGNCEMDGVTIAVPAIALTGNMCTFRDMVTVTQYPWTDSGYGNRVTTNRVFSAEPTRSPFSPLYDSRTFFSRDALPLLAGHVNPMPLNFADVLINPREIVPLSGVEGINWSRVADATADFKQVFQLPTTSNWTTARIAVTGETLPLTKVRVYVKAKVATAGTQLWIIKSGSTTVGTATLSFTTSYTVQSFDIDLSAETAGKLISVQANGLAGGGAGPMSLAFIGFRPWAADGLIAGSVEAAGVILKSPDGTRYIAKIANGGTWTISAA